MKKHVVFLVIMICIVNNGISQVKPSPSSVISYTQVMFEYPRVKEASAYVLQLVEDTTGPMFAKPLLVRRDSSTATMISGLKFGKKYLWRYAAIVKGKQMGWSGPYDFGIVSRDGSDKNALPVTVLKQDSSQCMGGLIAADFQCIIDRSGLAVWQMPVNKMGELLTNNTRDLRLTSAGTITFLSATGKPVEYDLEGNMIWQAPANGNVSGDTSEFYHHDFQRLATGNYMVLGDKYVWKKIPDTYKQLLQQPAPPANDTIKLPPNPWLKTINGEPYARIQYGTIIEYDKDGNVVWSWNSETYLTDEDVFPLLVATRMPMPGGPAAIAGGGAVGLASNDRDAHLNAFTQDDNAQYIYAGFRQLSRVIKIEKKSGKVVFTWGELPAGDGQKQGTAFFKFQHGADIMRNSNLLVFDNGGPASEGKPSRVVAFNQPAPGEESKVTWSFDCIFDSVKAKSHRGGNADELPNRNILVCLGTGGLPAGAGVGGPGNGGVQFKPPMGNAAPPVPLNQPMSRIFEVTPNKQIVWSAIIPPLQRVPYRVHYTSSLYPVYFTVQADADTFNTGSEVRIVNEGSETDSYMVTFVFSGSGITQSVNLDRVKSGASAVARLNTALLPKQEDVLKITIQSAHNQSIQRTLQLPFRK